MSGYSRGSLDVCLPLFFTHPYLHLDLHAAVRELLNHALDPYERLHLSERERERETVDKVEEASWKSWSEHEDGTHQRWHGGREGRRERLCWYKGDDPCSAGWITHCRFQTEEPGSSTFWSIEQRVRMIGNMRLSGPTEPRLIWKLFTVLTVVATWRFYTNVISYVVMILQYLLRQDILQ